MPNHSKTTQSKKRLPEDAVPVLPKQVVHTFLYAMLMQQIGRGTFQRMGIPRRQLSNLRACKIT